MTELLTGPPLFEKVVLQGLLRAREKIRIATANLKNFTVPRGLRRASILSLLRESAGRAVRIEILHGAVPSEPFLRELRSDTPFPPGRFESKFCPRVHFKAVIVDYRSLYHGSANFTGAGLGDRSPRTRNFELGVWTEDEHALDTVMALFDGIWSGEACKSCGLRRKCPEPLEGIAF